MVRRLLWRRGLLGRGLLVGWRLVGLHRRRWWLVVQRWLVMLLRRLQMLQRVRLWFGRQHRSRMAERDLNGWVLNGMHGMPLTGVWGLGSGAQPRRGGLSGPVHAGGVDLCMRVEWTSACRW